MDGASCRRIKKNSPSRSCLGTGRLVSANVDEPETMFLSSRLVRAENWKKNNGVRIRDGRNNDHAKERAVEIHRQLSSTLFAVTSIERSSQWELR